MPNYLIAFGGNVTSVYGTPAETMKAGLKRFADSGLQILKESRVFRTPSFPDPSGPEYANGAILVKSNQPPGEVIVKLHAIEADLGRERAQRWGERTIDLDILACDNQVLPNAMTWQKWRDLPLERQMKEMPDELILPHPRIQDRAFVLVPLLDVAPDWIHPITGLSVRQMLEALPEKLRNEVKPL